MRIIPGDILRRRDASYAYPERIAISKDFLDDDGERWVMVIAPYFDPVDYDDNGMPRGEAYTECRKVSDFDPYFEEKEYIVHAQQNIESAACDTGA
jgi:hypothetical protein